MAPKPWKPMISLLRSYGSAQSNARRLEELGGQPGLHGVFGSSMLLDDHAELVIKAKNKAKIKFYMRPEQLNELRLERTLAYYEQLGVDGLVFPCDLHPETHAAIHALKLGVKLILCKEQASIYERSAQVELETSFKSVCERHAFDGVAFTERKNEQSVMPMARGADPVMRFVYIETPERASDTLQHGASHLLIPGGIFATPRQNADKFWRTIGTLQPGRST